MSGAEIDVRRDLSRPPLSGFIKSMLREPFSVGALAPSSRYLANLLVTDMEAGTRVMELGAGTGAITQAILDAGVHANDLTLIEQNEEFAELLDQSRRPPAAAEGQGA